MDTTEASMVRWYSDQDNAQTLSGTSDSSPHQHRPPYTPSAAPHGTDLHYNSSLDPGPSFSQSILDPPSSSKSSSPSGWLDFLALPPTIGSQVLPEGHSYASPLPNTAPNHDPRIGYQPSAHSTRLAENTPIGDSAPSSRIAIRSGDPTPSPRTMLRSSRRLSARNSEQGEPRGPPIQQLTTGLSEDQDSTHRPNDSAKYSDTSSIPSFGKGAFQNAHHFIINNPMLIEYSNSETFMLRLLDETIKGAAFDSSYNSFRPRCLQGTRQATIDRTWNFINNHSGPKKIRCIIGPAGSGKSAVMQTLAEVAFDKAILGATIFFADYHKDMSKTIITLAYQLAVNYGPYRQFIHNALIHDPELPHKSLESQFRKLIVDAFAHQPPETTSSYLLVLLDGLDRCQDEDKVCEFLGHISEFSTNYPTSPLTWVISCRAEPHIMMFLGRVKDTYEEEELEVDDENACRDVERYLRYQLNDIKQGSFSLRRCPDWPEESDIMTIAEASKGFFAYANSVINFVKNARNRNFRFRLSQVMQFIDGGEISHISQTDSPWGQSYPVFLQSHPMSSLDGLYRGIMTRIPYDVQLDASLLLLQMMQRPDDLHFMCNWLRMTEDTAYSATYPLHSVLRIPEPEEAGSLGLRCYHPSFIDYVRDHRRSSLFQDIKLATRQLDATCISSLLSETINGASGLEIVPILPDIPLSWPEGQHRRVGSVFKDEEIRAKILQKAAEATVSCLVENVLEFQDPFYVRALIAFDNDHLKNDLDVFRRLLFTDSRRSEFIKLGVLKEMPLRMLNPADIDTRWLITCRFKCYATKKAKNPSQCGPSCTANWEECAEDAYVNRTGSFFFKACGCSDRLIRQLEIMKAHSPERLITIFLNLKRAGWIEYRFADPDSYGSEWTYHFPYTFPFATYPFSVGASASQFSAGQLPLRVKVWEAFKSISDYLPSARFSSLGRIYEEPPSNHDVMSLLSSGNSRWDPRGSPCHRGTRSEILSRVQHFLSDSNRKKRLYCIIGAAGCGKTVIMQTIKENLPSNVTACVPVFLSSDFHADKVIIAIAYQLALHQGRYKQFIKDELILDPSLVHKSLTAQFRQLIIKPFIHHLPHSPEDGCILILIDGWHPFYTEESQRTLLTLISDFCIRYPLSPLVWVISFRPELHIITTLDDAESAYEKEEIDVNGAEACEDVQRFLRDELNQIKSGSTDFESSQWPSEGDLTRIAGASQGFFAYAASVVEFIKSGKHGDPDSRLQKVLEIIDSDSTSLSLESQPLSSLNRLYYYITCNDTLKDTWPWLLRMMESSDDLRFMCNWLGMTEEAVYSGTVLLYSVLRMPRPDQANSRGLKCVHPSFIKYIRSDKSRGWSSDRGDITDLGSDIHDSTIRLDNACVRRILEEAPNGTLKETSGTITDIKVSWPEDFGSSDSLVSGDEELRFRMYKAAAKTTVSRMAENEPEFEEPFYVRALTAFENKCFEDDLHVFSRLLFDESRRSKFIEHGVLKEMSLKMISVANIDERWPIRCQFKSSVSEGPHPCNPYCQVKWIENNEKGQVCRTATNLIYGQCDCSKRLVHRLEYAKAHCPDRLIRVFINLHRTGFIECQSAEDGEPEWIYNIPYSFPLTG